MSAYVLFNLLNELGKRDKIQITNSVIQSTNVRSYLSYDIKITFISDVKTSFLSLCPQRCHGRHNVSRKSINH